jgi:cytosine/uracil/thiamine/allantoin permease
MGFREFINTIEFIGGFLGIIDGVIIVLMFKMAKKHYDREPEYSLNVPKFLPYVLILIFLIGGLSQLFT